MSRRSAQVMEEEKQGGKVSTPCYMMGTYPLTRSHIRIKPRGAGTSMHAETIRLPIRVIRPSGINLMESVQK